MTKMHHEYPKYPKTLKNDQNALKTTTMSTEIFKMTKIPLNPQNKQTKPKCTWFFKLWGYFGRFQVAFLILEDFRVFSLI